MYVPPQFDEPCTDVLYDLMEAHSFATLVTSSRAGIDANHLPLHLSRNEASLGILRGHVARSNQMWSTLDESVEALAIFHGPNSYISPSWYPSKQEHGRVVPTWNYVAVHVYGQMQIIDDPLWLRQHLEALSGFHEQQFDDPWAVSDAPEDFTQGLITAIVGFELVITRITGKRKAGQNLSAANRQGAVDGLRAQADLCSTAMADVMQSAGDIGLK